MIQAIFFDVDDTLYSHTIADVYPSTKIALNKLKEKGIKLFLATGRHINELKDMNINLSFDGYALLNGQRVLNDKLEVIYQNKIENEDLNKALTIFNNKTLPIVFVEKDRLYINYVNDYVINVQNNISSDPPMIDTYQNNDVLQFTIFTSDINKIKDIGFEHVNITTWSNEAYDVIHENGDKTIGIQKLLEYYHIDISQTMAFGDGINDISMIKYVNIGIAMGNANEKLKEVSDHICDSIDNDGILKALKYYKII